MRTWNLSPDTLGWLSGDAWEVRVRPVMRVRPPWPTAGARPWMVICPSGAPLMMNSPRPSPRYWSSAARARVAIAREFPPLADS